MVFEVGRYFNAVCHSKNIFEQVIKVCTITNTDKRTSLTLLSQPPFLKHSAFEHLIV